MRRRILALLVLALLVVPLAEAHGRQTRTYNASLGATYGETGFSTNRLTGPGTFTTTHEHYGVRITLTDTANAAPFIAVCIDLNGNGFCDDAEGDLLFEGHTSVEGWAATPFREVIVFSDAFQWDPATGSAHLSTRGTAVVEWLDGQQPPTVPPPHERDTIEEALKTLLDLIFGLGIL